MVVKGITGTYTLAVSESWKTLNLQEVRLECNTSTFPTIINLPDISLLNGGWNVKIYVTDTANNASANKITINCTPNNTIDQFGNQFIEITEDGGGVILAISSETQWLGLESTSGGGSVPATNAYGLFAQTADGTPYVNSTATTSLLGTGVGTLSVPAKTFVVGDTFMFNVGGKISNLNGQDIDFYLNAIDPLGNVILLSASGSLNLKTSTNKDWSLNTFFTIRNTGGAGVAVIHSNATFSHIRDGGSGYEDFAFDTTNNTTFTTLSALTLQLDSKWAVASVSNSIQTDFAILTKLF
jgi:hypothetical protein